VVPLLRVRAGDAGVGAGGSGWLGGHQRAPCPAPDVFRTAVDSRRCHTQGCLDVEELQEVIEELRGKPLPTVRSEFDGSTEMDRIMDEIDSALSHCVA
jgi:hypothetical protein